jgi:hypothetical protein
VLQALRAHPEIINRAFAQAGKLPTPTTQALAALTRGSAAFWPKPKPALPPITGADDPNGIAAIGETDHQNPTRCATDTKQARFLSTMSFISRDQMVWVVKGGCRFGEIDAVLRNVRFFLLGIPFNSHPLNTGTVWDNINIKLQYNFVGKTGYPLGSVRGSLARRNPGRRRRFEFCFAATF